MDGRKCDVLVEENIGEDPKTGMPHFNGLIVWADAGMTEIIKAIPGVCHITVFDDTNYFIHVDKRYDYKWVAKEIEAAVLCAGDK